ncbi:hypothetical protein AAFF_G00033750 [Aldrovandia affinis]|uniref:Adiponectin receptor 1a n=1 Tax=Aldrovandia affinis TaxID=143900 RepID=A0AAD7S3T6_9TELE|nr:hypothetical protein AAFF_G00033750 [Aldrovandia affinis]
MRPLWLLVTVSCAGDQAWSGWGSSSWGRGEGLRTGPMSARNGSASDAECQISEEGRALEDVELTELGPLMERVSTGATALPDDEEDDDESVRGMTLPLQAHHAMEKMEEFVYKVWEGRWRVIPYHVLPEWLKDNDYLLHGHRPPMPSFRACFGSIFRIHTETGNIWTHLLGLVLFLCLGTLTMLRPNMSFTAPLQEKVVFGTFFLSAVLCLSFSWLFHTVYCHSEKVSRTFSKLDYSGIALLIMGSFVPWLYYSFYCSPQPRLIYLCIVCVLGIAAIVVAQWDRFSTPRHRPTRAGVFMGLGLSGIVPTMHFTIAEGFVKATTVGQMGWFYLMGAMYITGAGLYAARIPERYFPGKCDIWFQSHQIFHVLVVAAAFIHFYGVSNLQEFRYGLEGGCTDDTEHSGAKWLLCITQLFLPSMRKKTGITQVEGTVDGDTLTAHWLVDDMYTFENVGFTKDVGKVKYLICADCEIGPIGWHCLDDKKSFYVALERKTIATAGQGCSSSVLEIYWVCRRTLTVSSDHQAFPNLRPYNKHKLLPFSSSGSRLPAPGIQDGVNQKELMDKREVLQPLHRLQHGLAFAAPVNHPAEDSGDRDPW